MYISNIEPRKTSADRGGLSTIHNLITKTRLLESIQADTMRMTKEAQIKMPFCVRFTIQPKSYHGLSFNHFLFGN